MSESLPVSLFERRVGVVAIAGEVRSPEDWTFTYDADHLSTPGAVPLSVSLPLRHEPHVGAAARNWFCNLLPEGSVRDAIVTRLRLPARDDFALLAAIGGECAGAVSVGEAPSVRTAKDDASADLTRLMEAQGVDAGEAEWALLGIPRRLSLAGAQDKIAVVLTADGTLRLPAAGQPSTHLIKPDSRRFRGLRELELLGSALARAVGLDAAPARPIELAGRPALLIERYDRERDAAGNVRRLHQEDFCQALGYPGELKYESQGGPSLAACSQLLRALALGPAAVQGLLDAVVFNALIGNADAHAKNLSLRIERNGRRALAPLYDLVPTVALPETLVDRAPALRIGTAARIDAIGVDDWTAFARETGYAPRYVLGRITTLGVAIAAGLPSVVESLASQGADATGLERAASAVLAQSRRVLQLAS